VPLLAVASCLTGCTCSITPPPDPADPVSVFVLDYGRHSSLGLAATDDQTLVEYAYGDWNWFALDKTEWYDVFPTLFWPTQGALGRRALRSETSAEALQSSLGCEEVLEIPVGGDDARALATKLDRQFESRLETQHYQPLYDLDFVHTDGSFHVFHNCNHVMTGWLREMGCRVRGPALFADFVVRPAAGSAEVRMPPP
jgi:hypothetical protein